MRITFIILSLMLCCTTVLGMTRSRLKSNLGALKRECMPRHHVTEDEVGRIEQGKFIEDHRVMCYIACVYRTVLVVRDGRLDRRMINSEVDLLFPRNMRTAVKNAVADCAYLQDEYDDFCEAMFYVTKCIYETDPDNFVFP